MKKFGYNLLIFFTIGLLVSCGEVKEEEKPSKPNQLTEKEVIKGWKLLFDGSSFDGWRGIGIKGVPKGHWKIEDGSIRKVASGDVPTIEDGQPLKGGDLITVKTFQNFELKFEWKVGKGSNSGVKYNVDEQLSIDNGITSALGYEYQVLDDENHSDNVNPTHRSGSLYDLIEATGKVLNPVGEFNSAKIVYEGNHIEHWLNGKKVVDTETNSAEFKELFKKSKYYKYSDFNIHKNGHIILQDHGDDCWYRNIKIKTLN